MGFVVSRAIPVRGKIYTKTLAGKDHIDIMDANKKTTMFVGASIRDDRHYEKLMEAAANRPEPPETWEEYELQFGLSRKFLTRNFEAF